MPGTIANPQSLNLYVYVNNRPTSLTDPAGTDNCAPLNPFTWGACVNNVGTAVYNIAVNEVAKPAANVVYNRVVKPVWNVVKDTPIGKIIAPVVPTIKRELIDVGAKLWDYSKEYAHQAYEFENQNLQRTIHQFQDAANFVSHLHITGQSKFATGMVGCGVVAVSVIGIVASGGAAAEADATIEGTASVAAVAADLTISNDPVLLSYLARFPFIGSTFEALDITHNAGTCFEGLSTIQSS